MQRKGVGEGATGEMAWGLGVDGRRRTVSAPHRALRPYAGVAMRGIERIRSRGLSRPGSRSLQARRQAGNGMACSRAFATELGFPRPAPGECKVRRRAERVIRPTRAKTRRRVLVITVRSPRPIRAEPAGQVMRHHLDRARVGGEARRRHVVQPDAVPEVAYGVLDLGVAAMIGLQFQASPHRGR